MKIYGRFEMSLPGDSKDAPCRVYQISQSRRDGVDDGRVGRLARLRSSNLHVENSPGQISGPLTLTVEQAKIPAFTSLMITSIISF